MPIGSEKQVGRANTILTEKKRYGTLTEKQLAQMRKQQKLITEARKSATHCRKGHRYTAKTTYVHPKRKNRHCTICREDARAYSSVQRYAFLIHHPDSDKHSYLGYKVGCRCDRCKSDHNIKWKEYYETRKKKLAATS